MLGCGQLVGSNRSHRLLKGFERPGGDARGLEIWFGDGEVVWDRGCMGVAEEKGWEEGKRRKEDKGRLEWNRKHHS